MSKIAVVYYSGFGHTKKLAEAVVAGAASVKGTEVSLLSVDDLPKDAPAWATLDAADAIIFGAPTYMGGYAAPFKAFIDLTSHRWMKSAWKDKLAAGFTNSGSFSGDKLNTLQGFFINAMQHGMIWVGLGLNPPHVHEPEGPTLDAINRLGSFVGAMSASAAAGTEVAPASGDLKTGELLGARVATIAAQFAKGKS